MGYGLMAPAGFAPQGFVTMFDKLQQANRLNDNGSWPYLRSHPLTTQRIADMDSRIPPGKRAADPVPTLEHVMMSARARVISNPGVEVRRQWATLPRSGSFSSLSQFEQVAQLYAATLSAMYLRDWPLAREMVQRLLVATAGNAPANIQARWLNAELEYKADNPQAALVALPLQSVLAPQAAPKATASGNLAGPREAGPREAGGLEHDARERRQAARLALLDQRRDGAGQVAAHRAAHAAVAQQGHRHLGGGGGEHRAVEVDFADLVDDHGRVGRLRQPQVARQQRGLAAAEEAGEHGQFDRHRMEVARRIHAVAASARLAATIARTSASSSAVS
jgi:predicted Zn-dependent protease